MGNEQDENDPGSKVQPPAVIEEKPSLVEWFENFLPFRLPRIPLPQTAKNLDKAVARIVDAGGENAVTRIAGSTQKQAAIGRGTADFIQRGYELASSKNSYEDERALNYFLSQAKIEQENRESIFKVAAEDLASTPPQRDAESEISDDWLNTFSRLASEKSESDIQQLWGQLLAGEIRNPGSIRLRTLSSLAMFDSDDAQFAFEFLRNAVDRQWILNSYYTKEKYASLLRAREIGIVSGDSQITIAFIQGEKVKVSHGSFGIMIDPALDTNIIATGSTLTALGTSIRSMMGGLDPDKAYFDELVEIFYNEHLTVHELELSAADAEGNQILLRQRMLWDKGRKI